MSLSKVTIVTVFVVRAPFCDIVHDHQHPERALLARIQSIKYIFISFQLWANYEEPKNIVVVEEVERKCNYKKVCRL